jgi:hypothetical protein
MIEGARIAPPAMPSRTASFLDPGHMLTRAVIGCDDKVQEGNEPATANQWSPHAYRRLISLAASIRSACVMAR